MTRETAITYERPTVVDFGTLFEITAGQNVGGPVDMYGATPGHSCPTGPPGPNQNAGATGINSGDPQCVGQGGGLGGTNGNDFPGNPDFNPANPGNGGQGTPPGQL